MLYVECWGVVGVFVPVGVVEFFGALLDVFVHVWDVRDFGCVGGLHGGVAPVCSGFAGVLL